MPLQKSPSGPGAPIAESNPVEFNNIGRIPAPGDNVAIASRRLEAGTTFRLEGQVHTLQSSLLEGQRFTIAPISKGEFVLSWGLPFGRALRDIVPGEYLCNAGILEALHLRHLDFKLPDHPNFEDYIAEYRLDEASYKPGLQVPLHAHPGTFEGYLRGGGRGSGTRNDIVILGTSSLTGSFARALEARLAGRLAQYPNINGIVAVAHTEGGGGGRPNILDIVLRTLAGFMVNPNVGAVLALDYGSEVVNNRGVETFLRTHDYPIDHVLHRFYSVKENFESELDACEAIVESWLEPVNAMQRTTRPLAELKIGLQCGGSDAFSGVSGNPLVGWVTKELVRHGGAAGLAETDELIGAEPYMLANTRDLTTAKKFLEKIAIFKQRVAWHGHSAEGNPSGGNKFRGLYNIALKSIGAARKKDPEVRLDHVIGYGEPMPDPGFYFMDSPGNDLESIAGQVASGCNLIYFTTGNGSITNFPFVPTIKVVTTTGRWNLLSKDMDVNAGRYQDGMPMEELGAETFRLTVEIASGRPSVGERAQHSQVSIWRDWQQTDSSQLLKLSLRTKPDGKPIRIRPSAAIVAANEHPANFRALPAKAGFAADQVGLIAPTSLCSGQIAQKIAMRLNESGLASGHGVTRFVALPHTEGCGASSGENEDHFTRTMVGHLLHPFVREALLLEHGCERTHNDLMRHVMEESGVDPKRFGYASIQLDGGIDKVVEKVEQWFESALPQQAISARRLVSLECLSLGVLALGPVAPPVAQAVAAVIAAIVSAGGNVILAANASLLKSPEFLAALGWDAAPAASLEYGQAVRQAGMHIMETPTAQPVETVTGLGGTGAQVLLALVDQTPLQGHPMVPMLQVSARDGAGNAVRHDMDASFQPSSTSSEQIRSELLQLICATASGEYRPHLWAAGNADFQLTRGYLGVSL